MFTGSTNWSDSHMAAEITFQTGHTSGRDKVIGLLAGLSVDNDGLATT